MVDFKWSLSGKQMCQVEMPFVQQMFYKYTRWFSILPYLSEGTNPCQIGGLVMIHVGSNIQNQSCQSRKTSEIRNWPMEHDDPNLKNSCFKPLTFW